MTRAVVAWSSGKDSAWALHVLRQEGGVEVVGLLTTTNDTHDRVAMHGVRAELLQAQADAVGLPVQRVSIPHPCTNAEYEAAMGQALAAAAAAGVEEVVFGDLFLEDIRAYREKQVRAHGLQPRFPLWGQGTESLARRMIAGGLRARIACLDPARCPAELAGANFDAELLEALPATVDPCGENGEFHTFAYDGPDFRAALAVELGERVERGGFVFRDLLLAPSVARGAQ